MPDDSYREFILDQLAPLGRDLECRKMFGGYGLYFGPVFFGILYAGRLYFKTDQTSRSDFEALGMGPFRPRPRQTLSDYYEVPVEVVENAEQLVRWARRAARAEG